MNFGFAHSIASSQPPNSTSRLPDTPSAPNSNPQPNDRPKKRQVQQVTQDESPTKHYRRTLHGCANRNSIKELEVVIAKGADINSKNSKGQTALYIAYIHNRYRHISCILEHRPDLSLESPEFRKELHAFIEKPPQKAIDAFRGSNNWKTLKELLETAQTTQSIDTHPEETCIAALVSLSEMMAQETTSSISGFTNQAPSHSLCTPVT